MQDLLETLASELERPRELSSRVINYLTGTYGIDEQDIGRFLVEELPKLEDDELDLILSPVFTPRLADQAVFAELLGPESMPRSEWPRLIQQLAARPTRAQLVTSDGRPHVVIMSEVTIERYVYRLRLDGSIAEPLFALLKQTSASDQALLKAVARSAVWESETRRNIFERYLTMASDREGYRLADVVELLRVVESNRLADFADLLSWIPRRQDALRNQIDALSGPPRFFNERAEDMHGGGRDQRGQDNARISAKESEFEFLARLQKILADA